jgi:hypothetical protein
MNFLAQITRYILKLIESTNIKTNIKILYNNFDLFSSKFKVIIFYIENNYIKYNKFVNKGVLGLWGFGV